MDSDNSSNNNNLPQLELSECDLCIHCEICTWIEKFSDNSGSLCINFIDLDYSIRYNGKEESDWEEMSFRKYVSQAY